MNKLDKANRRIENLLALLARERNRAERDTLKTTLEGRCTYCLTAPRMKGAKTCERCAL